jgi:hypothetical protein
MQVEGAIEEYQVVQTALDQLEIHLRADEAQHDAIRAQAEVELSKICADLRVQLPQVQIDFQYQAPERGVKVRRVLRTFAL